MRALLIAALITIVPAQEQFFPKNIIFVVDTSSSMDGQVIVDAMDAFTRFAGQPTDEMKIKVLAFQGSSLWWRKEWAPLPDADALEEAKGFLTDIQARRGLGGTTSPFPALYKALADPEKELAVVLISDGEFWAKGPEFKMLEAQLKNRVLGSVIVGTHRFQERMRKIGKLGRGGCYRLMKVE